MSLTAPMAISTCRSPFTRHSSSPPGQRHPHCSLCAEAATCVTVGVLTLLTLPTYAECHV
jgi:hypothetical protein